MKLFSIVANRRGVSILAVLVVSVIVAAASVMLSRTLTTGSRATAKLSHQQLGDQVLVSTASALQRSDFQLLIDLCNSKTAFTTPAAGNCTVGGNALNPNAIAGTSGTGFQVLEILRNFEGDPSPAGRVCIELSKCAWVVSGNMVEISLKGFWEDTATNKQLVQRTIAFRRTRW